VGSGVQCMTGACCEAKLAPPVFEEIGTRFRVTLFSELVDRRALDETDWAIVKVLAGGKRRLTSGSRGRST